LGGFTDHLGWGIFGQLTTDHPTLILQKRLKIQETQVKLLQKEFQRNASFEPVTANYATPAISLDDGKRSGMVMKDLFQVCKEVCSSLEHTVNTDILAMTTTKSSEAFTTMSTVRMCIICLHE
jgi:hypothetical protein